jgi:UDPglucose 6-dehydrogenase
MKIGVIGNGVVGSATARCYLAGGYDVKVHDIDPMRSCHTLVETLSSDIVFVCLPTPQLKDGLGCDTSALESFFKGPTRENRITYVIRSTVPVGYSRSVADRFDSPVVHSPEFLTERTANMDAMMPARNIIGFPSNLQMVGEDSENHPLSQLYHERFPHVPVHWITSDESEFVKLMQNSFAAVKIAFFNEMRAFADSKDMRWEECLDALLAGGTIHPMHTQVPGPDGKRGFGGKCFPKDLANTIQCMRDANMPNEVCWSALHRNAWVDRFEEPEVRKQC